MVVAFTNKDKQGKMELHIFTWGFLSFLTWEWFHLTRDFLKTFYLVSDKKKRRKSSKGEIHPPKGLSIQHISWKKWFSFSTKRERTKDYTWTRDPIFTWLRFTAKNLSFFFKIQIQSQTIKCSLSPNG